MPYDLHIFLSVVLTVIVALLWSMARRQREQMETQKRMADALDDLRNHFIPRTTEEAREPSEAFNRWCDEQALIREGKTPLEAFKTTHGIDQDVS